jgi:hypothetical protein
MLQSRSQAFSAPHCPDAAAVRLRRCLRGLSLAQDAFRHIAPYIDRHIGNSLIV